MDFFMALLFAFSGKIGFFRSSTKYLWTILRKNGRH